MLDNASTKKVDEPVDRCQFESNPEGLLAEEEKRDPGARVGAADAENEIRRADDKAAAGPPNDAPATISEVRGDPDDRGFLGRALRILTWTPKTCRFDPESPPKFSMALNALFGLVRKTIVTSS